MAGKEIVVIEVDNLSQGQYVLDELEVQEKNDIFDVEDAAVAYKNDRGKVKIRQTKDMTAGSGAGWGAGIGLVVGLFLGGPLGAALLGGGIGALSAGFGDKGISNEMMKRYEEHMNGGHALVFIQVDEHNAPRLADFLEGKAWQFLRQEVREADLQAVEEAHAEQAQAS